VFREVLVLLVRLVIVNSVMLLEDGPIEDHRKRAEETKYPFQNETLNSINTASGCVLRCLDDQCDFSISVLYCENDDIHRAYIFDSV